MLIDTHAHLWFDCYGDDLEEVLARAKAAGVEKIIVPGTDVESSCKAVQLAKKHPGFLYAAVGIHPEEVVNRKSSDLSFAPLSTALRSELGDKGTVAVGEIGMDGNTEELRACMEAQKKLFKAQLELAVELDLPVIIHTRDSFPETWEVLSALSQTPRGQFHCFSVDEEALKKVIACGFYVSFCGNITWSKRVAKLVSLVPDERLLLETDSPFMRPRSSDHSPKIAQGSELNRNEPAHMRITVEKIAALRGITVEKIAEFTTANAIRLFKL